MFLIATPSERKSAFLFALAAGAFLAAGFIPVSQSIVDTVAAPFLQGRARVLAWLDCFSFPALALAFYLSFPRPKPSVREMAWATLPLPWLLGFFYGLADPSPGLFSLVSSPETQLAAVWALLLAPLGEELVFRGWLFSVTHRLWPDKAFTATNPLPVAVWVTALAFCLWHTQNWALESPERLAWQLFYTFPAGLWLGWLRWKSGGLFLPILAHIGLNLATSLF